MKTLNIVFMTLNLTFMVIFLFTIFVFLGDNNTASLLSAFITAWCFANIYPLLEVNDYLKKQEKPTNKNTKARVKK